MDAASSISPFTASIVNGRGGADASLATVTYSSAT
jgi:hypothetical protein